MTPSELYRPVHCLWCGQSVPDFDGLAEHQSICPQREGKEEIKRAIRETLAK